MNLSTILSDPASWFGWSCLLLAYLSALVLGRNLYYRTSESSNANPISTIQRSSNFGRETVTQQKNLNGSTADYRGSKAGGR